MIRKKTKTQARPKKKTRLGRDTTENRLINVNFRSKSFLMVLILFIFILILAFFFGEGGIMEIIKARTQIEELRRGIRELEQQKIALEKEIEELKKNPLALERKAREKLWLMKKNEKVVVIVRDKNKKNRDNEPQSKKKKNQRDE